MKIVVFGATGRTGLPLVQQALDAGHQVVAFVRDPAKMSMKHDRLTLVQGDVMNAADVDKAITPDMNAVISVLAPVRGTSTDMLPIAAENMLTAMKRQGVNRLIYMTGVGVSMPEDKPDLLYHLINFGLSMMGGDALKKSEMAARKVQSSSLDWTILRAPMLIDGPHSGQYRVGWVGVNMGPRISRADAADFLLKQLTDTSYLRKAPAVSN